MAVYSQKQYCNDIVTATTYADSVNIPCHSLMSCEADVITLGLIMITTIEYQTDFLISVTTIRPKHHWIIFTAAAAATV